MCRCRSRVRNAVTPIWRPSSRGLPRISVANWTNTKRAPERSPSCLSELAAADFLDHHATTETLLHDARATAAGTPAAHAASTATTTSATATSLRDLQ